MKSFRHRVCATAALTLFFGGLLLAVLEGPAAAEEELNIYSSRHYDTDSRLFQGFTEQTGIKINLIEGSGEELVARILNEGVNSPADILISVDAGRLWRAEEEGIFQPVSSEVLEERIPAYLRHPDGLWYGFSTRARTLYYNPEIVEEPPATYEDLADPRFKGLVCIRSSSNVYNLSLMASMIEVHGEEAATEWAEGVVANFARRPQGGDTDQLKAVAAGECGVAVANHYYYLRLFRSDDPADQEVIEKVKLVWANQEDRGVHVNISGAGVVANAPHPEAALAFLEYLTSDDAQIYFTEGNNEYPVVEGVMDNPILQEFGEPKRHEINMAVYGELQPLAQMIFDRVGWP